MGDAASVMPPDHSTFSNVVIAIASETDGPNNEHCGKEDLDAMMGVKGAPIVGWSGSRNRNAEDPDDPSAPAATGAPLGAEGGIGASSRSSLSKASDHNSEDTNNPSASPATGAPLGAVGDVGASSRSSLSKASDHNSEDTKNPSASPATGAPLGAEGGIGPDCSFLQINILRECLMHKLASHHFICCSTWLLFLPSILITMVIGILNLLKDSKITNMERKSQVFSVVISCLAIFSTVWQGLSKQLDYSGKARVHKSAALATKRLTEDMTLIMSIGEGDRAQMKTWIERFSQGTNSCDSVIPQNISTAFAAIHTRIHHTLGSEGHKKISGQLLNLYNAVFDQLELTICTYWLWPFFVPNPQYAVEKTIIDLRNISRKKRVTSWRVYLPVFRWFTCCNSKPDTTLNSYKYHLREDILEIIGVLDPAAGG